MVEMTREKLIPIIRDQLARSLYAVEPHGPQVALTMAERHAGADEWDAGQVKADDMAECYGRADQLLAVFR